MKNSRLIDFIIGGIVFLVCCLLYNATLTPSLSYASPDGNELTTVAATLGLAHPTGYPLYTWLGFLFTKFLPIGDVAHRTNLMSAILGAAGVAMLYHIARRIELHRAIAAFAALLFGVSTTFWSQTVITEVYAPNVFMMALTLWLMLQATSGRIKDEKEIRPSSFIPHPSFHDLWFILFALSLGLSLGTHMSNLSFALAYALFVLLTDWRILKRPLTILAAFAAFMLGVAQFLWLPLRAFTAVDPLALRFAPVTPVGFYLYTLGAFSNLRFAFPISALPDRISIYLTYLSQNFTVIGIALGLLGMWALLFRHPKRFWLLMTMYSTSVFFFTQYKVFDLDVFFIPSHFLFAIFIGCGAQQILEWISTGFQRTRLPQNLGKIAATLAMIVLFYVPTLGIAATSARDNNRATDTAIGDFYKNVYAMLPQDSTLVTRRGVFGYDAFYWREVYNVRSDVTLPTQRNSKPPTPNAPIYSTVRIVNGEIQGGLWAPPRGTLPEDAWFIPVLVGNRRELILYRAEKAPPMLVVANAQPQTNVNRAFDGITLVGYDATQITSAPSPRVHLKTYWRITQPRAYLISSQIAEITLETHDLGFGNLARHVQELRPTGNIIVEEYDLVVPSHLKRGTHALKIGLAQYTANGVNMQWTNAGSIEVK